MLLLAIEQSTSRCSVALTRDGTQIGAKAWSDGLHKRQQLFTALPELLAEHGLGAEDVEHFAVGTGPGSFAGIRIAISACHGLAQPSRRPVSGFASTATLAWRELQTVPDSRILVVGDARREKFWCAAYVLDLNQLTTVLEPQLISPDTLTDRIEGACVLLSPDMDRIGDALRAAADGKCRLVDEKRIPDACDLAQLANTEIARGHALPHPSPIYLHPAVLGTPDSRAKKTPSAT